jgi:taurine dioxygenase
MEVLSFDAALGAEVKGLDLAKPLNGSEVKAILQAWADHQVLLFRNQHISDHQLAEFSQHFGILDVVPSSKSSSVTGLPEVAVISNVVENGKPIGALGDGEASWHTDMSYVDTPPIASILLALEVPHKQGNTYWANMYMAYDDLTDAMKARVDGLTAVHDASHNSAGELREGYEKVTSIDQIQGARHPIVRQHPVTGRKALFLGRRLNGYIEGFSVDESEALLDELWAHCVNPKYVWGHEWQPHDVLIWDNRCTIHRRDSFDNSARRILHRTQIRAA